MRFAQEPYTCCRCNYKTPIKARMVRHLNTLKTICPGTCNNIELTKEIKDCIVENRVYKIPKTNVKKIPSEIDTKININEGNIYIFYTRACKNIDEPVYKIGKSYNYLKRAEGYDKGGDMIFVVNVSNRHTCENLIKKAFSVEFKQRKDYGAEYFEGDIFEMVMVMKDILEDYISETVVEFKELINT